MVNGSLMTHPYAHLPSLWAHSPMDWVLVDQFGAREALKLAPAVKVWLTTVEGQQMSTDAAKRFA